MSDKIKIISTHIENDLNKQPTVVFTDEQGIEWVLSEQLSNFGGYITQLVKKSESWYFNPANFPQLSISENHEIA